MDSINLLIAIIALSLAWIFYKLLFNPYDYWKKRGVPYVPAVSILGSMLPIFKVGRQEFQTDSYKKYGRVFGHFASTVPVLNIGDPELLRLIMSKDFNVFPDRKTTHSGNPITDTMLPQLRGEDWKRVRSIITPAFTTGKLKKMYSIIVESTDLLCSNLAEKAKNREAVNVKRYFGAFSMDVIATTAFGTKVDSLNDPENAFVQMAKTAFSPKFPWRLVISDVFPLIRDLLRISTWPRKNIQFFRDITIQIVKERKRTGQRRNDFLQLLIDVAEETNADLNDDKIPASSKEKGLTMDELVANSVIFFLAGYDTTASTLSFVAYVLALNPDVQDSLIREVDETLKKHKNEITHETLQDLKYMDMVISETLRLYPPAVSIDRQAVEDYKLGNTGITIEKGQLVNILIYAIHHDPEFYPDPEKFDPERFSPEQKEKRDPFTYIPFGAGPRLCIGMRFVQMEMKIALIQVLKRFRFKRCSQTQVPLKFGLAERLLNPKQLTLTVEERTDNND